jgi:putative endonuclease
LFSKKIRGISGEEFVCCRLKEAGFKIIKRNVREKFAEIDIVAEDKDTLCFIEVRTRETAKFGHPAETIDIRKQQQVRRAAQAYLIRNKISNTPIRFDVATIVWSNMEYLYFKDAF